MSDVRLSSEELREVLAALQHCASHEAVGEPEQRGLDWGPPEWHEGVALWLRVLAITDVPTPDTPPFVAVWEHLVEQAHRYLETVRAAEG